MRWATLKLVKRDLQTQTVRFQRFPCGALILYMELFFLLSFNKYSCSKLCMVHIAFSHRPWHMANLPPSSFLQTEVPYRLNGLFSPPAVLHILSNISSDSILD